MELTNILGQSFLVNVDSVVLAYARGSDAALLLSKGNVLQDVQESVAEVVTASDSGLTAFTATSGDYTGSIAVNPNYIITVTSASGGNASTLVIGDNTATRATVTVDTDYDDMDAIIEAAAGGGGDSYLKYVALLTQSSTDAPTATVLENTLGGTVVWSYNEAGNYTGTLTGAFTANKTVVFASNDLPSGLNGYVGASRQTDNTVQFNAADATGNGSDLNGNAFIEIRVYP